MSSFGKIEKFSDIKEINFDEAVKIVYDFLKPKDSKIPSNMPRRNGARFENNFKTHCHLDVNECTADKPSSSELVKFCYSKIYDFIQELEKMGTLIFLKGDDFSSFEVSFDKQYIPHLLGIMPIANILDDSGKLYSSLQRAKGSYTKRIKCVFKKLLEEIVESAINPDANHTRENADKICSKVLSGLNLINIFNSYKMNEVYYYEKNEKYEKNGKKEILISIVFETNIIQSSSPVKFFNFIRLIYDSDTKKYIPISQHFALNGDLDRTKWRFIENKSGKYCIFKKKEDISYKKNITLPITIEELKKVKVLCNIITEAKKYMLHFFPLGYPFGSGYPSGYYCINISEQEEEIFEERIFNEMNNFLLCILEELENIQNNTKDEILNIFQLLINDIKEYYSKLKRKNKNDNGKPKIKILKFN